MNLTSAIKSQDLYQAYKEARPTYIRQKKERIAKSLNNGRLLTTYVMI